ncbi:nickel-responsive transcriptional regulator NikR [Candidatus Desulfovibrio trichonymphae]|uniref:Putative nickel-responsive regulator n=1 Tax=Candidatus Desulfovibrio trichonymphae TaxID=1725232 RepID=A0A1J1DXJ2_9BACT|nr:nickel-responsive transcriptional regulator NikR [Candidatus Desulfovibrio trichonymphae]BAV91806.1 nickel-responsive transcriptional regulator NikR [Candidatus Desulfovibrio trichonymphae]GHU97799.1 putative nickel-responsive regulator [Deltaproteobacteria bacterium]
MGKLARFGVSLDEALLEPFDGLCRRKSYSNRSEAIRDLIRKALVEETWREAQDEQAGTLTLVYDHHKNDLARRLMNIQHGDHDIIVTTLHVHLDHHNCLEVLVIKGQTARVHVLADRLISCKGVKHGTFTLTTTGQDLV